MQCAKCGADNPEDAFFCGSCGVQLRSSFTGAAGPPAPAESAPVNPIGSTEPYASQAYQSLAGPPPAPDGIAAPPPAPAPPPYQPPQYPAPPPAQYQQYQPPPPPQFQGGPGGNYGVPGYGLPPDGNTSGMGAGYPIPPQASGWTFSGFVPFGIFHLINGNTGLGVLGVVGSLLGIFWVFGILNLGYCIYVGITGRESAWRNRRFNSISEYDETMRAWNTAGLVLLIVGVLFWFCSIIFFAAIFAAMVSESH